AFRTQILNCLKICHQTFTDSHQNKTFSRTCGIFFVRDHYRKQCGSCDKNPGVRVVYVFYQGIDLPLVRIAIKGIGIEGYDIGATQYDSIGKSGHTQIDQYLPGGGYDTTICFSLYSYFIYSFGRKGVVNFSSGSYVGFSTVGDQRPGYLIIVDILIEG